MTCPPTETLEQLALARPDTNVPKVASATFETLHQQARLQRQPHGDFEQPLVAVSEVSGSGFGPVRQRYPGENIHDFRPQAAAGEVSAAAADMTPLEVASSLRTAAYCVKSHHEQQSVELAWTGPDADGAPFRRTEQAILQILDSAVRRITLVSYAVYKVPHVCGALTRAARRGVAITVIVETPEHDTHLALRSPSCNKSSRPCAASRRR